MILGTVFAPTQARTPTQPNPTPRGTPASVSPQPGNTSRLSVHQLNCKMLSTQTAPQRPQRPSIYTNSVAHLPELYSDARLHGHQGPTRTVRLPGAATSSGGAIAKSEDGERCVVAGKESAFFGDGFMCTMFISLSDDRIHSQACVSCAFLIRKHHSIQTISLLSVEGAIALMRRAIYGPGVG